MFCMCVIRKKTDQLDNKYILKNLLKEMNNVETILDVAIVHVYHLKTFGCS